jgi:predicted nucleotidyltransferase
MSIPRDLIAENPGIGGWAILHGYRGSIAHGMYVPQSDPDSIDDKDTMAFCVPPADHYLGLAEFGSRGTQEIKRGEWDIVVYETRKAIRLLAQGNPNVMSMLWLPENMTISTTPAGLHLLAHRDLFVGRHAYKAFVGYAVAQARNMEGGAHRGYMGEKRKALVERHGYDAKNAMHLIRLLRMGIEFVRDGELNVHRHGAQELLAIKAGEWPLEKVKAEADRLYRRAEDAYDRTSLPVKPDPVKVNALCVEVVEMALAERPTAAAA